MTSNSFIGSSLLVAFGGGCGAWLRLLVNRAGVRLLGAGTAASFPWATLTCNVVGSLAMGLLFGWLLRAGAAAEGARLLLGTGVLGGFTTFSAFALEFALFVQRDALGLAALYVGVSLVAGFAALFAGLALSRGLS